MINSYDDIKTYYDELRIRDMKDSLDRRNATYEKYPEIKLIDYEIADICVDFSIKSEEKDEILKKLEIKRSDILKKNNLSDDYMEPNYICKICKDTGIVDGKKCECFRKLELDIYNNYYDITKDIKVYDFDKINMKPYIQEGVKVPSGQTYADYMSVVIAHMRENISHIGEKEYNAIIMGSTGVGKTYLAKCIAVEAYKKNKTVLYVKAHDYIDSFFDKNKTYDNLADEVDLLIFDDMGLENTSDFSFKKIFTLIDKRLENKKSTIITTNYTHNELKEIYDDRIMSRIYNKYYKYRLYGMDLRSLNNG